MCRKPKMLLWCNEKSHNISYSLQIAIRNAKIDLKVPYIEHHLLSPATISLSTPPLLSSHKFYGITIITKIMMIIAICMIRSLILIQHTILWTQSMKTNFDNHKNSRVHHGKNTICILLNHNS